MTHYLVIKHILNDVPEILEKLIAMTSSNEPAHPSCDFLEYCPVWKLFQTNSKLFWIQQYCQGPKQEECLRKQRVNQGIRVPDNMLPNGDLLS